MSNMAIEAGAKVGIIAPDAITEEYVKGRAKRTYQFYQSDADARYEARVRLGCFRRSSPWWLCPIPRKTCAR